jgi:cation transport ATPase
LAEVRGSGVEANIQHSTFNAQHPNANPPRFAALAARKSGVDLAAGEKFMAEWSGRARRWSGWRPKTLLGLFAVRDAVKPNAAKVVNNSSGRD